MKKTMFVMVLLLVSLSLFAAGNKDQSAPAAPGYGYGPGQGFRGQGGPMGGPMGGYGFNQGTDEELPAPEEVTLKGTFIYKEGIAFLQADGKDYHVMASPYAIAQSGIVKENDQVTVEGLLFPAFEGAPFTAEGNLMPLKVTKGSETYILPARGPLGGRGPRGGRGGARCLGYWPNQ